MEIAVHTSEDESTGHASDPLGILNDIQADGLSDEWIWSRTDAVIFERCCWRRTAIDGGDRYKMYGTEEWSDKVELLDDFLIQDSFEYLSSTIPDSVAKAVEQY
jgi:hypothetical protein